MAQVAAGGAVRACPGLASARGTEERPAAISGATAVPPQEFATDDPAFYQPPSPIPSGAHGDLIRFQVAEDGAGGRRYRIMYLSETVGGAPTVVTGLVDVPSGMPPFGGYPLILDGHGSTGLADRCAPSQMLDDQPVPLGIEAYGGAAADSLVIASTDFEGLGGPGDHPLLVGVSGGRSMLDAGLAARQIPGVYVGAPTGIIGFSEGGHAGLWAAQLAPEWTPTQPILGAVIAAPASEVVQLAHDGVGSPEFEAVTLGIVAGLAAAYPEATAALDDVVTGSGRELITAWHETSCFFEDVTVSPGGSSPTTRRRSSPSRSLIAANMAGTVASPTPLLVIHATEDERIPFAHNQVLVDRLCAAGQVVQNLAIPGDHVASGFEATSTGVEWFTGLVGAASRSRVAEAEMRRTVCSLFVMALVSVAGHSTHAAADVAPIPTGPVEFAADDPAFYTVPEPLPAGEHGDLLRFQLADEGINLTYRIMYLSESLSGTPIAVTGLVVMSDDPAPFGGYDLLLHGHGSTGLADRCAPSAAVPENASDLDLDYESFETMASFGFALVSTDYEGLGVPGSHPFFDGVSEGRSMLDAGRRRAPASPAVCQQPDRRRRLLTGRSRRTVGSATGADMDPGAADLRGAAGLDGERDARPRAQWRHRSEPRVAHRVDGHRLGGRAPGGRSGAG